MKYHDFLWALQQCIIRAVKQGDLKKLELYMNRFIKHNESQSDINQLTRGPERNNLLHYAVIDSKSSLLVVNMLVNQYGMDTCAQNFRGETPFYLAAMWGEVEVMRLLYQVNSGCAAIYNYKGFSPVYAAAINNQVESLKFLESTCNYDLNARNQHLLRALDVVNETKQPQAYQFLQKEFKRYSIDLIKMCSSFYPALNTDGEKPKANEQASPKLNKLATECVMSKTHLLSTSSRGAETIKTSEQAASKTKQIRKGLLRQARQAWSTRTSSKKIVRSKVTGKRTADQSEQKELGELQETLQASFKAARHSP